MGYRVCAVTRFAPRCACGDYTWQAGGRTCQHATGRLHSAADGCRASTRLDPEHAEVIMTADDRRFEVLRAIVSDYVATREPVGSKSLVDRHQLGVSPATIRNDMAVLEDEGYIAQPHTSAGRIPTDKGYRLFVDRLSQVKPLSAGERKAIQAFLSEAVDLDDVLRRSVRLLAQLTRQVAVVQYPTLARSLGPARRGGRAGPAPAAAGGHHRHRPGRAAAGRTGRRHHRRGAVARCVRCSPPRCPAAGWPTPRRRVTNLAAAGRPRRPARGRAVGERAAGRAGRAPGGAAGAVRHLARHRRLGRSAGQPARRAGGTGRAGDAAQAAGRAGEPRTP